MFYNLHSKRRRYIMVLLLLKLYSNKSLEQRDYELRRFNYLIIKQSFKANVMLVPTYSK